MDVSTEWWTRMRQLIAWSEELVARSRRVTDESDAIQRRVEALLVQANKVLEHIEEIRKQTPSYLR